MPAPIHPDIVKKFDAMLALGHTVASARRECGVSQAWAYDRSKGRKKRDQAKYYATLNEDTKQVQPKKNDKLKPEAQQALDDFAYFRLRYTGRSSVPWQVDAANTFVKLLESPDKEYVVVNCPPGAGKSTLMTHDIPLWLICRNRAIRILIGSATQRQATLYTNRLRRSLQATKPHMANDDELARGMVDAVAAVSTDFGRFKPDSQNPDVWRAEEFSVAQVGNVSAADKEHTVSAFGKEGGVLGNRVDLCVWDDLQTESNMRTVEAREDMKRWWKSTAETRIDPRGVMILQGQRMGSDDLYRFALDMKDIVLDDDGVEDVEVTPPSKYKHIVYKAHYEDKCNDKHPRQMEPWPASCLLDPYNLPWRELARTKLNGLDSFLVQYQQADADPSSVLVNKLWVTGGSDENGQFYPGCWDSDRGTWELPPALTGEIFVYATIDPSPTRWWGCIAAGTPVVTRRGEVPIESVDVSDEVMTRGGWRRVQHQTYMGDQPTVTLGLSDGRRLTLTRDHRVHTPNGWVEAGSLSLGSPVTVARQRGTGPAGALAPVDAQVRPGVLVASGAVGASHLVDDVRGALHVDPTGDVLEMVGVHASSVAAEMVDLELDVASGVESVTESVRHRLAALAADAPVAADVNTALPDPAAVAVGLDSLGDVAGVVGDSLALGQAPVATSDADVSLRTDLHSAWTQVHVASITPGLTIPVYDIGVVDEEFQEFVAGGVLVHNCQVWAYHPETERHFLLDLIRKKMQMADFLDRDESTGELRGLAVDWQKMSERMGHRITTWIVEKNAAQLFFFSYSFTEQFVRKYNISLIGHQTTNNKSDPKYGVQALGPLYRSGRVRLPGRQGDGSRLASLKLVDEVTKWPHGASDDQVMSQWFGFWNLNRIYTPVIEAPRIHAGWANARRGLGLVG